MLAPAFVIKPKRHMRRPTVFRCPPFLRMPSALPCNKSERSISRRQLHHVRRKSTRVSITLRQSRTLATAQTTFCSRRSRHTDSRQLYTMTRTATAFLILQKLQQGQSRKQEIFSQIVLHGLSHGWPFPTTLLSMVKPMS